MNEFSILQRRSTWYSSSSTSKIIPQKRSFSFSTSQLHPTRRPSSLQSLPDLLTLELHQSVDPQLTDFHQEGEVQIDSQQGSSPPEKSTPLQLLEGLAISFIMQLNNLDLKRQDQEEEEEEKEALRNESHQSQDAATHEASPPVEAGSSSLLLPSQERDQDSEIEEDDILDFEEEPEVEEEIVESSQPRVQETKSDAPKAKKKKVVQKMKQVSLRVGSDENGTKSSTYLFPTVGVPAVLRLARLLKVISELQAALIGGIIITKRDIYYRDKSLFGNQSTVDKIIDSLCKALNVKRSALGVAAASKGLICGVVAIEKNDGQVFNSQDDFESLIPGIEIEDVREVRSDAEWILIVEKEASFKTLMEEGITLEKEGIGKGIMITGKGYPDLSTRQLVKILSEQLPHIPILALVDCDPYGLDILKNYKYGGSTAMELAVDRIEWAGVKGSEWDQLGIDWNSLLPFSQSDRIKTLSMLQSKAPMPEEWRRELARSLHLNQKAEIQLLCSISPESVSSQMTSEGKDVSISSGALLPYIRSKLKAAIQSQALLS